MKRVSAKVIPFGQIGLTKRKEGGRYQCLCDRYAPSRSGSITRGDLMAIRRRIAGAAVVGAIGVATALGTTGPANAAGRNISSGGIPAICDTSPYVLCLHWDSNLGGAMFGTNAGIPNLAGYRFPSNGAGGGQLVKNNAASMSCDAQTVTCYSFYNENYSGNYDYAQPQRSGNLFYTWNDEASVRTL